MLPRLKNEIRALLVSLGFSDEPRSLQSKKECWKILDALKSNNACVLKAQSAGRMFEIIERNRRKRKDNWKVAGWTDRRRWDGKHPNDNPWLRKNHGMDNQGLNRRHIKFCCGKYAAFCELVHWGQDSNGTIHYGKITKRRLMNCESVLYSSGWEFEVAKILRNGE